ncbi:MAG TPA: hypothetical protein VFS31_16045, partial [Chitinophagaceae bacterium]|nr:hypothetical protein [Chitinophagaceae bacterium]
RDDAGNLQLDLDIWLKEVKTGQRFRMFMRLVNKVQVIKDTLKRFVDSKGNTSYFLDNKENLVDWMLKNDPHEARIGEVELYKFMRAWQGEMDFKNAEHFTIDWDELIAGNVMELNSLKETQFVTNVLVVLAIRLARKDGETKEYQTVYNRAFLPGDYMRYFVNNGIKRRKEVDTFVHEVCDIKHGCRDFFGKDRILRPMHDYNPDDNPLLSDDPVLNSDDVISDDASDDDDVAVVVSADY